MNLKIWFRTALLGIILAGCATPTWYAARNAAVDPDKEWKYTERQAAIAGERAVLIKAAKFNKEKGVWELDPNIVSVKDVLGVLNDRVKSLDDLLSYRDRELSDMIDWFKGFRKGLEREEKIALWLLRRLLYLDTFNEFIDLVGELPPEFIGKDAEYFFPHGRKTYSLRTIYPMRDIRKIPFTAIYLEAAKKQGLLTRVDSFSVSDTQTFGKKILNLRDQNEFTWEKQYRGWRVDSYKITADRGGKPDDSVVHYVEVYRISEQGTSELLPAVRGFLASGGQKVTVFVVDYDKEGEDGFGEPDAIKKVFSEIITGRELYLNAFVRGELLESLYERPENNKKRPERRKPIDRPVYTEIVPMGKKVDVLVWEEGTWSVPFDYSQLAKSVEVVFKPSVTSEEKKIDEVDKGALKRTFVFVKKFKQEGKVVVIEYWVPKKEYAERNIVKVESNYDATLTIRRKGMIEEKAEVEHFARSSTPKTIEYFFGGKWFRIVDEDGDGIFEKKREIADPTGDNNPH